MPTVQFVDTTLRDGNQSLWSATGVRTSLVQRLAPVLARAGFRAVELITSTHMAVAVRWHREDPWERIRLARRLMPGVTLGFLTSGVRFITWYPTPEAVMRLAFECLVRAGIDRFWVADPMNDTEAALRQVSLCRAAGAREVVVGLVYTLSPIHSDAFYAQRAERLAKSGAVDALYIKDPGGLLTPERVRTLVPAIRASAPGIPLEIHSHCNTGLAPICYLEAVKLGVETVHTAISPLANGTSQPATETVLRNLRHLGFTAPLDEAALAEMARIVREYAEARGLPLGAPVEYDVAYYDHQVPGGMMSTLKRQLAEIGMLDRLPAVLEEVVAVRRDLGYPIMVTPFSQFVATQALLNVVSGERYAKVPDEVIRYVLGQYGEPPAPIDPDVRDRVLSQPRARELAQLPDPPTLEELRRKVGGRIPDEELVLRACMPADQVDAMLREGPVPEPVTSASAPFKRLLQELAARKDLRYVQIDTGAFRLRLSRGPDAGHAYSGGSSDGSGSLSKKSSQSRDSS